MTDQDPWRKRGEALRRTSIALAIPSLFLAIPLVGLVFGWVFSFWGRRGLGFVIGVVAGLAVAIRETVRILKVLSKD